MEDLDKELSGIKDIQKQAAAIYQTAERSFGDQKNRVNETIDNWAMYNCELNHNQAYEGSISNIYVPLVHDAVEARVTRYTNQLFPGNGRYVEVITEDGTYPYAHMALLENYVNKSKLRTEVIPALIRNGDIEGQYTVNVTWKKEERKMRYRKMEKPIIGNLQISGIDGLDDIEVIAEQSYEEGYPDVDVVADADITIFPVTSKSIDDAIENGGGVARIIRMSKGKIAKMAEDGKFTKEKAKELSIGFSNTGANDSGYNSKSTEREMAWAAGIKTKDTTKVATIYEVWAKLKVNGKRRLCVIYFGGADLILSVKLNPYWNDKCPLISIPARKLPGICKGIAPVTYVSPLQYMANDAANLGMSSGIYALMPIVMTDPEKNPRIGSMMMNVAAIWQTSPKDTQIVEFPDIYQKGLEMVDWCKSQIMQSLSVNPSMITSGGAYRRPTQAETANEQMVDVLTTADAVTVLELGIMNEIIERFYDYDRQFRTTEITIRAYGQLGIDAAMEVIEPIQDGNRYTFRWWGVEQSRTAQQIQQQTSAINVLRGIPPQLLNGKRLDIGPFIERLTENAFGPRLAPKVLVDDRKKLALPPGMENDLFAKGYDVPVNELDEDVLHLEAHLAELDNDVTGHLRVHIEKHQKQLMEKQQEVSMAQQAQAYPSGASAGGVALPAPGSSPAGPSNTKSPPGTIHDDQLIDPSMMPRERL